MNEAKKMGDLKTGDIVLIKAIVLEIFNEGVKASNLPIKAQLKFEESGEVFTAVSWNFQILPDLKTLKNSVNFAELEIAVGDYNGNQQIKLGKVVSISALPSSQKKVNDAGENIGNDIKRFVFDNVTSPIYKMILAKFVTRSDYLELPAARGVHHAYLHGLAIHSLGTARVAKSISDIYNKDSEIDMNLVVTGALLHDIGKTEEYNKDCEITIAGSFISHLVSGVVMLEKAFDAIEAENKITIDPDLKLKLKHIIVSHHEKLEYGSPVVPKFLEAVIISDADKIDSQLEAVMKTNRNLTEGMFSEPQKVLSGTRIYKWKKQL